MRTMTIQAVLFDADGVVVFPWRFAQHLELKHSITRTMTRDFFRGPFENCLLGKADLEEVLPPFLTGWGWTESVDSFIATWLETEHAVDQRVVSVIHTLRQRGIACYLATNQERHRTHYMRTAMGFSELFDRLFISCEIGHQKPDPGYFAAIEEALDLSPERLLFWDDAVTFVEAARARRWHAELYTGFESFQVTLPQYVPAD